MTAPADNSAGYGSAGHDDAGPGERGYGGRDTYAAPGGYGDSGSYGGPGAAGPGGGRASQPAGYGYGGGYDEHEYDPGPGAGQHDQYPAGAGGYGVGGYPGEQASGGQQGFPREQDLTGQQHFAGRDDYTGEQDYTGQQPYLGEQGYSEPDYSGQQGRLDDDARGAAEGPGGGSRYDWQAPPDDTGVRRRRDPGGESEIDADSARHNNFFRGFGRGDDDYTHRPPKKRRRSRAGMVALSVLIIFLAVVAAGGLYGYNWYAKRHADWSGSGYGTVIVQVKPGGTAYDLSSTLVQDGVIAAAAPFRTVAEESGKAALLEPGSFRLHKHMSAAAAWALIINPKARVQTSVAVPDGLRASRIIALLAKKTGIPLSQFQSALKNDVSQLGLPAWAKGNPEGFLYPATYPVQPGTSALDILKTMVAKFNSEVSTLNLASEAKAGHFTNEYEVIIEASLLEAEVGAVPQYYGKVAGVIDNRLNQHWYLGLNSTVAYALNKYGSYNLSQSELHTTSKYNTMNHYGVPPGPIDSPDLAAIEAVLHPTHTTAMYFITINKAGTTRFTDSAAQFSAWSQLAVRNGV